MSNFSKEIIYQIHEYQKDIGDIVPCEKCGKYVSFDEYVVNFGLCDDCMNDSLDDYIRNVIGIENLEQLSHNEIEMKINDYYVVEKDVK